MSGFSLEQRYFFMPGFPEMAQPMIDNIIENFLPSSIEIFTQRLLAQCGEGKLIHLMMKVPNTLELSSLPIMNGGNPNVEFSLSSDNKALTDKYFKDFTDFLKTQEIAYKLLS